MKKDDLILLIILVTILIISVFSYQFITSALYRLMGYEPNYELNENNTAFIIAAETYQEQADIIDQLKVTIGNQGDLFNASDADVDVIECMRKRIQNEK